MNCHLFAKSGDVLGEFSLRIFAQSLRPLWNYDADRVVELANLRLVIFCVSITGDSPAR